MNHRQTLLGAAWLASLAIVYFFASSSESAKPAAGTEGSENGAAVTASGNSPGGGGLESRERTMRRTMDQMGEMEKKEQPNIPALVARARLQIGGVGMMNNRGMLRAMAPFAELDEEGVKQVLAEVERTIKEPQQKMMFYSVLLVQWAETNGPAALEYADEKLGSMGPMSIGVRAQVFGTWSGSDPDAAWAWYQKNRESLNDSTDGFTVTTLFGGMASRNLDSAIQRLSAVDESSRMMALNGIANAAYHDAGRSQLIDRAAALPNEQRAQLYQSVATLLAITDPAEAVKWIRTLPAEEQKPLRQSTGGMLLTSTPQLASELLLEGVEEKDKPQIYSRIATQWAYSDPRAAGEWLAKQPQGPALDSARSNFASAVVQKDPAAAMDWAKSVQNEDQRSDSINRVYGQWRNKDAAAANAALDASGLPAEKIKQFKDAPAAPKSTSGSMYMGF